MKNNNIAIATKKNLKEKEKNIRLLKLLRKITWSDEQYNNWVSEGKKLHTWKIK